VAARVGAIDASSTIPLITGTADIVVLRSELVAPYCRLLRLVMTTTVVVVVVVEVVLQVDGHEVRVARASDQLEVVRDGEVSDAVPAGVDGA